MAKAAVAAKKKTASKKFTSFDDYLSSLPAGSKSIARELRSIIKKLVPAAEEGISYNMPGYKLNGKGLIWFAAWKQHIAIYPLTTAMEASIKGLSELKGAKHTLQLPMDQPLPTSLITKMIKFRLKELAAGA